MASIDFNDGSAATLASSWPTPANRFRAWEPFSRPFGEGAAALGSGKRYQWAFRTDYGASFEIAGIANTDVDIALRLMAHLIEGGTITVNTADVNTTSYSNCCLAPETMPELTLEDRAMLEYTLKLTVVNLSGAAMLCEY